MKRISKHIPALLLVFIFSSFITSCAFKSENYGEEISDEKSKSVVDGKTTKTEILLAFGDPSRTMDNEKVFFYSWTEGGNIKVLGIGGSSSESKSFVVIFDSENIVKNHKITRGATANRAR